MVTLILTLNIQDKIYLCLQKRKDEEGAMDDSTLIEQIQLGSKNAFKQMFIKFYRHYANMLPNMFLMRMPKNLFRS